MASIKEFIKAKGDLSIVLTGPDGNVKDNIDIKNTVVTVGKNWIASRMKDGGPAQMTHMSIGSGATGAGEAVIGDTQLVTEEARVALGTAGGAVTDNTIQYTATFGTAAAPNTGITEAGIFNAVGANAGTMLCRTTFNVVNKGPDDTLTITWTVTIS